VLVLESEKIIRCSLRGKFKKEFHLKKDKLYYLDIAVIGDRVNFNLNNDNTGVITKIHERINYLSRKAPRTKGSGKRGERLEQIIGANIDNFFIVTSVAEPKFNNKVVDRLLVTGESSNLNNKIILNKIDLRFDNKLEYWIKLYSDIGYDVIQSSTIRKEGIEKIKVLCKGKKNIFWGQSGVGKSSILNTMFSSVNLEVGKISPFSGKGIHKTVTGRMIKIGQNTFIIDNPGIREIEPFGLRKQDLGYYFIEFKPYLLRCKFNTCTHFHEPECAVIRAVEKGKITKERYESYLRMLKSIEEDIIF